ncbi:unnamed protein product [Amoebophrya sp. A120]|nr:unnamed protein product [Amoebophrya sp. A120]|eukprot:GSA120T00011488001.1
MFVDECWRKGRPSNVKKSTRPRTRYKGTTYAAKKDRSAAPAFLEKEEQGRLLQLYGTGADGTSPRKTLDEMSDLELAYFQGMWIGHLSATVPGEDQMLKVIQPITLQKLEEIRRQLRSQAPELLFHFPIYRFGSKFLSFDFNKDGALSPAEFKHFFSEYSNEDGGAAKDSSTYFAMFDANADGQLLMTEMIPKCPCIVSPGARTTENQDHSSTLELRSRMRAGNARSKANAKAAAMRAASAPNVAVTSGGAIYDARDVDKEKTEQWMKDNFVTQGGGLLPEAHAPRPHGLRPACPCHHG